MGPVRVSAGLAGTMLIAATLMLAQQHSYTQADIDAGSKIYDNSCGGCHGENGDKVVGIDFVKGQFKTARNDDDLVRIIRSGVPNTAMPSHPFSEAQADTVVAYVRSMLGGVSRPDASAAPVPGDAARGKTIFEGKGNCVTCHAVNGTGGRSGPDLALTGRGGGGRGGGGGGGQAAAPAAAAPAAGGGGNRGGAQAAAPAGAAAGGPVLPPAQAGGGRGGAGGGGQPVAPAAAATATAGGPALPPAQAGGARGGGGGGGGRGGGGANPQQIQRSILEPNAEIAATYRIFQVVPKSGAPVRGTLLNQDTFSVQLRDSSDKLFGFVKSDLREYGFMPSPMPSYKDKLTSQEVADVVSYLISVR